MTSSPPPTEPGLFTLDLVSRTEASLSKIEVRAESQREHLGHGYVSLSLAARNLLAVLRYYGDQEAEAEREFSATLEQDPGNLNAMHSLVHVYRKSGRAELESAMQDRLQETLQQAPPSAHAQRLAEQAYTLSFECFGSNTLRVCHDSNAWLKYAIDMMDTYMEEQVQDTFQKIKTSIAEWRLCTVWNLKKAYNRSKDTEDRKTILLEVLTTIWELLKASATKDVYLARCYLGYFLGKLAKSKRGENEDRNVLAFIRQEKWMNFLEDPALCFEQALSLETLEPLDQATRNEARRLYSDFLVDGRREESTITRLSSWLEEAKNDGGSLMQSHLLLGRARVRSAMVNENWRGLRHEDKLRCLRESVEDLKTALQLRPHFPLAAGSLAENYNRIACVYKDMKKPAEQKSYGKQAADIIYRQLRNPDRGNHALLYRELQYAFDNMGVVGTEVILASKRRVEYEVPWRVDQPLSILLKDLAAEDRTQDPGVAAAASAAFWISFACSDMSKLRSDKIHEVFESTARAQPEFAKKVCACARNMLSNGELFLRDGSWLEDLEQLTGSQAGHVDSHVHSHVQRELESDRSEFSPPVNMSPRNCEGVAWDVGVVCAPEDVTWFRRGAWRYLVRELGMKVQLLPPEGDVESLSRDCHKLLVVVSASLWTWVEASGHVAWLRGRGWRQGAGLLRGDAPPPPHLQGTLAVLTRSLTSGDWAALLEALL